MRISEWLGARTREVRRSGKLVLMAGLVVGVRAPAPPPFPVAAWQSWAHIHKVNIPYRDSHGLTPFAATWLRYRKECGAPITPIIVNWATLSRIELFQGCWMRLHVTAKTPEVKSSPWVK